MFTVSSIALWNDELVVVYHDPAQSKPRFRRYQHGSTGCAKMLEFAINHANSVTVHHNMILFGWSDKLQSLYIWDDVHGKSENIVRAGRASVDGWWFEQDCHAMRSEVSLITIGRLGTYIQDKRDSRGRADGRIFRTGDATCNFAIAEAMFLGIKATRDGSTVRIDFQSAPANNAA